MGDCRIGTKRDHHEVFDG
jgi:hypothetical protein